MDSGSARRNLLSTSGSRIFPRRLRGQGNREIDLPFEGVNPSDEHRYLVADLESSSRASANELPSSGLKQVKVVRQ